MTWDPVNDYTPFPPAPATPPRVGLMGVANTPTDLPPHWQNGIKFRPENTRNDASFEWWEACQLGETGTDPDDKPETPQPDPVHYHPWVAGVDEHCSTEGFAAEDFVARARRRLVAVEPFKIEHEFWTGAVATAAGFPNNFLANPLTVTDLGARPLVHALAELTQYLAEEVTGRGMIHATPRTIALWQSAQVIRREGNVWLDAMDNFVVAGSGYDGTDPDGVDGGPNRQWAYATSMVTVLREPDVFVNPPEYSQAVDRAQNSITFRAERNVAAFWDGLAHAGIEVNLCNVCCTEGSS